MTRFPANPAPPGKPPRAPALLSVFFFLLVLQTIAAPRLVIAPRAASPPALDGRLDDACWQDGAWHTGFTDPAAPEKAVVAQTRFQIAHDDEFLYLAARLDEPNMDKLRAECRDHDDRLWTDDCLEVFLDPYGQGAEYRHFIFNARGAWYDASRDQGGHVGDAAWDAAPKIATARGGDHWTVEVAFPLAELGLTSDSVARWGFNVGRERYATGGEAEVSSFTPMQGGFHKAALFAPLELRDANLRRYLVTLQRPTRAQVVRDGDQITLVAESHLANDTGRFRFFAIEAIVEREGRVLGRQHQKLGLDDQQGRALPLRVPISADDARGAGTLRLTVAEPDNPAAVRARRHSPVTVEFTPLTVHVTQPGYRNCIYATEKLRQIEGVARVFLSPARLPRVKLQVAVVEGERSLRENVIEKVAAETAFRLDARRLPVGNFQLTAELLDAGGRSLGKTAAPLRKLPPHPNEIRLDSHKFTLLNGKPFFPYGWFSIPTETRPLDGAWFKGEYKKNAARGINVVMDYDTGFYPADAIRKNLDEAHAAGLRVMFLPLPEREMQSEESMKRPLSESEARKIRERVHQVKDHPGFLGWYMGDEIEAIPAHVGRLEEIYRVVCEEDPYHPCVLLNNTIEGMHKYARCADVLMPDPYPLFTEGTVAARGIDYLAKFVREIGRIDGGRLGAWITPEGFNYGDFGQPRGRAPEFHELRCQFYQAAACGASGCIWYSYWYSEPYPQIREGVWWLAREAAAVKPALVAPHASRLLNVKPAEAPITASYRVVDRHAWIFAVSAGKQPLEARLELPKGAPKQWHVVSEDRTLAATDGVLADRFEASGTHIYTTDAEAAGRERIADALAQIEQVRADRLASGNLALRDREVTASSSSSATYCVPPRAIDGSLMGLPWRSKEPAQLPEWIEVRFPAPQTVGRIVVSERGIKSADVQVRAGDAWKTLAPLARQNENTLTAAFEPVSLETFRIRITEAAEKSVGIRELEAYGK